MKHNTIQHTPGPWEVRNSDYQPANTQVWGCASMLADCDYFCDNAINEANARLIAAAPDLLSALKACIGPEISQNDLDSGYAAIAKAEGR